MRTVYLRFLTTAIRTLHRTEIPPEASVDALHRRLLQEMGDAARGITLNDIVKGWEPNEN
jgi:hypothetical protein